MSLSTVTDCSADHLRTLRALGFRPHDCLQPPDSKPRYLTLSPNAHKKLGPLCSAFSTSSAADLSSPQTTVSSHLGPPKPPRCLSRPRLLLDWGQTVSTVRELSGDCFEPVDLIHGTSFKAKRKQNTTNNKQQKQQQNNKKSRNTERKATAKNKKQKQMANNNRTSKS